MRMLKWSVRVFPMVVMGLLDGLAGWARVGQGNQAGYFLDRRQCEKGNFQGDDCTSEALQEK